MSITDRIHCIAQFNLEVERWLIYVKGSFRQINKDDGLTPEDKKRLKDFYLNECLTPRIREAVKKYFPEEFAGPHPGNQR